MKKYAIIFLAAVMSIISASVVVYAVHENVVPYESILSHMPWPAAGDLRYHITIHKPYKDWAKWPGKGEMYKGTEPHGSLLTAYVNDIALDSITKMKGMAKDSIIVKENYSPDKQLMAVTVMYKVKGFNPDGGDWLWAKYDAHFNILAEGKVQDCLGCHGTVKDNDYIFSGKVTGK